MTKKIDDEDVTLKKSHEREAARVNLRKMLDTKKRGDQITPMEIVKSTGFDDWRSFGDVIRRWARSAGCSPIPVRNEGWRLASPDGQVTDAARDRRAATRRLKRAAHTLATTPVAELSDVAAKRHERELLSVGRLATLASDDDKEIRKEFKLGVERVPLRIANKMT